MQLKFGLTVKKRPSKGKSDGKPKEHFDLPTYRFIAPEKLGYTKPGGSEEATDGANGEEEAGLDGRSRNRRRRGRRGGQRRRGQPRLAAGNGENGADTEAQTEAAPVNGSSKEDAPAANAAPSPELDAAAIAVMEDDKPKGFGWLKKWLGL